MVCPNCGKEVFAGDKFCMACGFDVSEMCDPNKIKEREEIHTENKVDENNVEENSVDDVCVNNFCVKCGAALKSTDRFCSKCGASIAASQSDNNNNYRNSDNASNQPRQTYASKDASSGGFAVLCAFMPVVGLILYLVWKDQYPLKARSCGKGAIVGVCISVGGGLLLGILSVVIALVAAAVAASSGVLSLIPFLAFL